MKASQLIAQLSTLIAEHGDLTIIGQADQEGNSYDMIRGADFTYVSEDLQSAVDSLEEAEEYSEEFQPVIVVYP
jgi:hypothetical protein